MPQNNWNFEPINEDVLPAVHALNQRYKDLLSSLTLEEIRTILGRCFYRRCLEQGKAFATAMDDKAQHDGENFNWFERKYSSFVYVERIAIDESLQRRGLAKAIYEDIEDQTRKAGREYLCAEVNLYPPNQGSLDFHEAMGFARVGTGKANGKIVQYFAKLV